MADESSVPVTRGKTLHGLTSRNLAKALFNADVPEQAVRELPAQALYMAIKHNGLPSSAELIEVATIEQCQLMLDFDLWERDTFREDSFWEWMSLTDTNNDLSLLQKTVKSLDLKLVALLISRHVDARVFEERTDLPPGPDFFTPDKGSSWIHIKLDGDRLFLMGRLLALLFETNTELFYRLMALPASATESQLEEEAFIDKNRRLSAEGIPDRDTAWQINQPLPESVAKATLLGGEKPAAHSLNVMAVEPLVNEGQALVPLAFLLEEIPDRDEFEGELTLITNAAIVHFGVEYYEHSQVLDVIGKVKGALNIGLETAQRLASLPLRDLYSRIGVRGLYRLGLGKILDVRKAAQRIGEDTVKTVDPQSADFALIAGARDTFPAVPVFFRADGNWESEIGLLKGQFRALETVNEVEALIAFLEKHAAKSC